MNETRAGIDAGASLWKLAFLVGAREEPELAALPAGDVEAVRRQLAAWRPGAVLVTGGGAARLISALAEEPGQPGPAQVSEFAAWPAGAPLLAARAGWTLPARYHLVSLGTGTSILEDRKSVV